MKLLVVINRLDELSPSQTTAALVHGTAARGHDVYVADAADVGVDADAGLVARARGVVAASDVATTHTTLRAAAEEPAVFGPGDTVLVRTNPGRDARTWVHGTLLEMLRFASDRGVDVRNDPSALMAARSKLFLMRLPPEIRPRTLISRSPRALRSFVEELGSAVLKPLEGTHGQDVFFVDRADANLDQIIEVLVRGGFAMAQERLPGPESGDTRVVLLDGEPLIVDGHMAAVRRVPQAGELRSNVHRGAHPEPGQVSAEVARVCEVAGAVLRDAGIWLAGLDVMGGKVLEANVFSTGGLGDAELFEGVDFTGAVIDALERRAP